MATIQVNIKSRLKRIAANLLSQSRAASFVYQDLPLQGCEYLDHDLIELQDAIDHAYDLALVINAQVMEG